MAAELPVTPRANRDLWNALLAMRSQAPHEAAFNGRFRPTASTFGT